MKQSHINIFENCKNIREYIVNCYIYCDLHFTDIHDYWYKNDLLIEEEVSKLLIRCCNNGKFNYLDLPIPKNANQSLINLFVIDGVIGNTTQGLYRQLFSITNKEISCYFDLQDYYLLSVPNNPIVQILDKNEDLRRLEDRPKGFPGIFKNFIVSKALIKGVKCKAKKVNPDTEHILRKYIQEDKTINVGIFSNYCLPVYRSRNNITSHSKRSPMFFDTLINENDVISEIDTILNFSFKNDISIIVLPELFVYQKSRDHIKQWLEQNNKPNKIIFVVAGSMHLTKNIDGNEEFYNESVIFDHNGICILEQKKFDPYIDSNANSIEHLDYNYKAFYFINTLLGRMSISICLDFISQTFSEFNKQYFINFNLVPALSSKTQEFRDIAKNRGSDYFSSTLCANNTLSNSSIDKGFIYLPANISKERREEFHKKCTDFNINDELKISFIKIDILNFTNEFK